MKIKLFLLCILSLSFVNGYCADAADVAVEFPFDTTTSGGKLLSQALGGFGLVLGLAIRGPKVEIIFGRILQQIDFRTMEENLTAFDNGHSDEEVDEEFARLLGLHSDEFEAILFAVEQE